MRPYHSAEDRMLYREKMRKEAEERIINLGKSWEKSPKQLAEYLTFSSKFHQYSARNRMLIYSQNPYSTFVGGYEKFVELGYYIRKGEHGMRILAPAPVTYFRKTPQHPWRRLSDATDYEKQQVKAGMLETREEMHFRVGTVFDITQTTCPLEDYPKLLGAGYNDQQHAELYRVISDYSAGIGMAVSESETGIRLRGTYNPLTKEIQINSHLGDTQKLSTLLHEMSHGIMQHSGRDLSLAQREFEADALSIMFEDKYGIPVTDARCQHLAEHFNVYQKELALTEKSFDPEIVFSGIHERFEMHEQALATFLEERGVFPQEPLIKLTAEPPVEQPAKEIEARSKHIHSTFERVKGAVKPKRSLSPAQENYTMLHKIAPSAMMHEVQALQLRAEGFEPLRMEWIGTNELALSQIRVENGQPLRHPEMVLRVEDRAGIIQPLMYRDDSLKVYREVGVGIEADLSLRRELNSTLNSWLRDIEVRHYEAYDHNEIVNELHRQMWQEVYRYEAVTGIDPDKSFVEINYATSEWQPKDNITPEQIEQRYQEAQEWFSQQPRLFVDMDGTVANIHQEENYLERMYEKGFFAELQPYSNTVYGLQEYMLEHPEVEVYVLSATVESPHCIADKHAWLDTHLTTIDEAHRIFVPMGENKTEYIPGGIRSNDILMDDYNKNLAEWRAAGGYAVKHVNDINDRGLHGERFHGARVHYDADPQEICAQITGAAAVTQVMQDMPQEPKDREADYVYRDGLQELVGEMPAMYSPEDYGVAIKWMAGANRDQLLDTVPSFVAGSSMAEDTYKLAAALVCANDPNVPPELQRSEASGITYVMLHRAGIPCSKPILGCKLDPQTQRRILQHIKNGVAYMQNQINGMLQAMPEQHQAGGSQSRSQVAKPMVAPPMDLGE